MMTKWILLALPLALAIQDSGIKYESDLPGAKKKSKKKGLAVLALFNRPG